MRRLLLAAVTVVAVLTACSDGSDGLSDEEQEFVDAAMEDFDEEEAAPLTEEDAECIVTSMVESVGVDDLEEAGITAESFASDEDLPEGLTREQATEVVSSIDDCVDLRDLFLDGFTEAAEDAAEVKSCLEGELDDDFAQQAMVSLLSEGADAFNEDSELTQQLSAAFEECSVDGS